MRESVIIDTAGSGSKYYENEYDDREQFVDFDDTSIVAYLHYKGHKFVPINSDGKRIKFRVYGNIDGQLEMFYRDEMVPIQSFVKSLKAVRSSMFTFKNIMQGGE